MNGSAASPSPQQMRHHKAALAALAGVYIFAFSGPWSTSLVDFGMLLILAGSLPFLPELWRDLRREPIFWAIIALLVYLIVHTGVYLYSHPELDEMKNPHWSHWLRTAGLWSLLLGWWLYRRPAHIRPVIITLLAGLVFGWIYAGDHMAILSSDTWTRWIWGYAPNYLGLASGMALLTVWAWLLDARRTPLGWLGWIVVTPLLAILVIMLYGSGSLSAWVAFPFGLGVVICLFLFSKELHISRQNAVMAATVTGVFMVAALAMNPDFMTGRLAREWDVLAALFNLDVEGAAGSRESSGFRVAMWVIGIEAFFERPLFGWGAGSGIYVLENDDLPFRHFHSIYLEVLVSFGLFGAAFFALVNLLFFRKAVSALRTKAISQRLFVALAAVTVFFLIKMTAEIRIGQSEGRALITTLYAFYAFAMFRRGAHD